VASYSVLIKPSAAREIEAVDQKKDRRRIVANILALAEEPRPAGCEKLAGQDDRYRIRVGRFRVVYSIVDAELVVLVVRVADRKDVHRYPPNRRCSGLAPRLRLWLAAAPPPVRRHDGSAMRCGRRPLVAMVAILTAVAWSRGPEPEPLEISAAYISYGDLDGSWKLVLKDPGRAMLLSYRRIKDGEQPVVISHARLSALREVIEKSSSSGSETTMATCRSTGLSGGWKSNSTVG
jgi:mRNA interferase RelE/StbE